MIYHISKGDVIGKNKVGINESSLFRKVEDREILSKLEQQAQKEQSKPKLTGEDFPSSDLALVQEPTHPPYR